MSIQNFASRPVEEFFLKGRIPRRTGWTGATRIALRKLDVLDYAEALTDLRSPPGNRLEALKGDRKSFHSIRINDQWRIIFRWTLHGPADVDIVDYH